MKKLLIILTVLAAAMAADAGDKKVSIVSDNKPLREPLKIHFGGQTNLFDSGRRQKKQALASAKPDFSSLPEVKNLLLAAQKQLLELPLKANLQAGKVEILKDDSTGQYRFVEGDRTVLQYNYNTVKPPAGYIEKVNANNLKYAAPRSNYIHPLFGSDGEELTLDWSIDHPHHRGIYWAWPEVQYKGKTADLHALQNVFARPTGEIKIINGKNYAEIQAENRWFWQDKEAIVHETANIRVWPVSQAGRFIDLNFTFKPLVDGVTLARRGTKLYGGLNIRMSAIKEMKLAHHIDPADPNLQAVWQSASGIFDGGSKTATLTVFEKQTNVGYPGDYIQYPYLPWFQPTFPKAGGRYELKKDKPLVLKYRLWIRSGPAPTYEQYRRQWQVYQDTN